MRTLTQAQVAQGQLGHQQAVDVLGQWRMRVPRHTALVKDCLALLAQCTSRLALTADPAECEALFRWLRHVATVGDAKSLVELVVMTEVTSTAERSAKAPCTSKSFCQRGAWQLTSLNQTVL
jgi:hypothetical protein